jgi:23S rRNA (adenine2503-C2)-methyltransferase
MNKDLKSMSRRRLGQMVVGLEQKKYLARYIFSFIHARDTGDIDSITPLSKAFRGKLIEQGYYISRLDVVEKLTDPDGTVKYIIGLPDGQRIQSVLLSDDDRKTLCVSTQVGCSMGCVLCATARLGFRRNLTAGEIVDQVNTVMRDASCVARANYAIRNTHDEGRITNVVYMGMGEPLANYDAVLESVRILNDSAGMNIGIRHLTISTCGVVEGIRGLADEDIAPRLAISLNAPTDSIRARMMPIAKKYPLKKVLGAAEEYQRKTGRRVTFEYVLIKGLNDKVIHAELLCKVLRGVMCNVNLIEYNPHPGCAFEPSGKEAIERFARVLEEKGFETTIRFKKGQRIKAACGQLGAEWIKTR